MANKNFIVKNGLEVGGQEVVSSSGVVTSAALGGQTLSSTDSPTFNNLTVSNDLAVSGDLNLTGDLNITGDVNSLSVTDLDVTDQTITLGAGQVESASGGSGIIIDGSSASILWDETNTEFDINNPLHITTAAGTTAHFTAQETSGATTSLKAGGSVGYVGTYSDHPFRIVTNTGTKIYVATDGKIGIGSNHTNPLQTVDISGSAAGLNLQGGNNRIYFSNYRALEGATDGSLLQVGEGFTDIALQGNVGIGATSPATLLDVSGTTPTITISDSQNKSWTSSDTIYGKVSFKTLDASGIGAHETAYVGVHADVASSTTPAGRLVFGTSNSNAAAAETMTLDGNGFLGLGTTNPSALLTMTGNSDTSDESCMIIINDEDTDVGSQVPAIQFRGNDSNIGRIRANGSLGLILSGSSAQGDDLVVQAGGVGIGTTSPGARLHVITDSSTTNDTVDVARIEATSSGTPAVGFGPTIDFRGERGSASSDSMGRIGFVADVMTPSRIDGAFVVETAIDGVYSEALRITSNGNLKFVGQTTNFESPGFTYNTNNYLYLRGGSAGLRLDDDSSINTIQIADGSSGFIKFETGDGTERLRIDASGNVGIGLAGAAASQKLHVNSGGTNVVARFESTDGVAGIMLKDSTGNVELETYNGVFRVNPGGAANPYSFTSGATSNYFTTTTSHSGTNQDFDFSIQNNVASNYGPRVRLYGGGQSSGVSSDVPWDNQQGYNIGSFWFDSAEGPSIYGAGIVGYAESDFNANDTPAALAFYTTPDGTGAQTNTAKERLRIRADGTAHFSPSESDTRIYIGSSGGLTGGNSSNWVRASGSTLMYNCAGGSSSHIWETAGTQRFQVTNAYTEQRTDQADTYTIRSRNTASGDPGLSLTRDNVVGFGIAVRGATDDYADFQVNSAGATSFGETGKLRLYHNGNVSIPGTALWSTGVGNTFGTTGNHYMIRTSSSTGNETIIINNTQAGSVGVLQYRESGGVKGTFFVADTSNGIYSTSGSDYRFKENVATITDDHLTKLTSLRPITYTHSADYDADTSTVHTGFIAHEVEEIFPEFVEGEKDAVWTQEELDARGDPDTTNETAGDPKYQTIAYERKEWNVYIVRALQQLKAENDALKARIEALEG